MRVLFNNCGMKALSLLMACILFSYVYTYLDYRVTQTYSWPLEIRDLPDSLALRGWQPDSARVRVRVSGPVRSMRHLGQERIVAWVDAGEIEKEGRQFLRVVIPEMGDLQIVGVQPATIDLDVEKRGSKTLPVGIASSHLVASGFVLVAETIEPKEITVSGPQSLIDSLASASLDPKVPAFSSDTSILIAPELIDTDGAIVSLRDINLRPERVRLSVQVRPESGLQVLRLLPDLRGDLPAELLLGHADVTPRFLAVEPNLFPPDLHSLRLEPYDLSKLRGSQSVDIRIRYPEGQRDIGSLPKEARLDIEVLPFDSSSAEIVRVRVEGLGQDLGTMLNPREVVLRSEELAELGQDGRASIYASVNLSGLGPGEYRVIPQLVLPAGLERFRLDPPSVHVTIIQSGSD